MRLQFVSPLLHELDVIEAETLACCVWEDVRPMDGLAALCDWRFGGRLSRLLMTGFFTGRLEEVTLVPGRPGLAVDKLILLGAGPRAGFDETRFDRIVERLIGVLDGLSSRSVIVELPGRHAGAITPERAADRLLEALTAPPPLGLQAAALPGRTTATAWTLVEDIGARRHIEQHMVEERRRIRPES